MIDFPALGLTAPDGSIIGVIQEGGASDLPGSAGGEILSHDALSRLDAVQKALTVSRLVQKRRAGATVVLCTHDEPLLESCADEVWWLRDGKLIARGHPAEILPAYRRHVAQALREAGRNRPAEIAPALRDGDGRAQLQAIELLGADGAPAVVWRSGETAAIRVTFGYEADVADPVIGILIRTRIGLNVYGTNTELENIHFGPMSAGDTVRVTFRFCADLCPGDYTVTAASHDPDGVWHDWLEDAVAFAVSDDRYSAGVANLRAQVAAEVLPRN
ncbi:MAG TPA: Wzt carbohydrate-binding domain-containing protein [Bryobacteraceae bacterium]|nr:Wzt carbohydrate-binding domain-containing protein [Bryobacteraceae bacterium]